MLVSPRFALLLVACFCGAGKAGEVQSADDLNRHGADLERQGRSAEAEAAFRLSLDACRQNGCPFLGAILNNLGSLFYTMARYRDAEQVLLQAIEVSAEDGQDPAPLPTALVNLGEVYRTEARYVEAGRLYERALKLRQDDPSSAAQEIPKLWTHMAVLAQETGDSRQAEELIRKALASYAADGSLETADGRAALVHLGGVLTSEGKLAEAEAAGQLALAGYRKRPPGADDATALNNLGGLMTVRGRPKEAEALLRESLAMWERLVGPDHPSVAPVLMNLGALSQARHRYGEAEALMDRAARIDAGNLPSNHPRIAIDLKNQAGLRIARGRYSEAEQLLLRASSILEQRLLAADPELGQVLASLGEAYRLEKRIPESREKFERGIKILNAAWGPLDPRLVTWLDKYASVLRAAEEYTEAAKLESQATHIRVLEARRRAG
jgi:tetratricopeptide (TPR) repeat protein